jgi:hypothetical protein
MSREQTGPLIHNRLLKETVNSLDFSFEKERKEKPRQ